MRPQPQVVRKTDYKGAHFSQLEKNKNGNLAMLFFFNHFEQIFRLKKFEILE